MTKDEITAKAAGIVAKMLDVDADTLTPETEFVSDLGADSLDSIELTIAIEEAFDFEMTDADASDAHTFGRLVETVERKLSVLHG
jgi:acyl carrier protein